MITLATAWGAIEYGVSWGAGTQGLAGLSGAGVDRSQDVLEAIMLLLVKCLEKKVKLPR